MKKNNNIGIIIKIRKGNKEIMRFVTDPSIREGLIQQTVIARKGSTKKPHQGNVASVLVVLKNGNTYSHRAFAGKHKAGDPTQDSERIVLRNVFSLILRKKELRKEMKLDQSFFDQQLRECAHRIRAIYLYTERKPCKTVRKGKPCKTVQGCWDLLEAIGRKVELYVDYNPNFPKTIRK